MGQDNSKGQTPRHVAIIMDGNGRWAKERGLPRLEGHRQGGNAIREAMETCRELGIRYLTVFAFSVENWKRPQSEIDGLMKLLVRSINHELPDLVRKRVRLRTIGEIEDLPPKTLATLKKAMAATAQFEDWNLIVALNYGSRSEVVRAAVEFSKAVARGEEDPDTCDWSRFSRYLDTADIPDPDLLIRTSGETRLSNFLLLQCAYAEMFFSPVYWPDFSRDHFLEAIDNYRKRERRYGLTGEQVRRQPAVLKP
ncbi:MAG: polyprenyl diphosphate synthase [Opitutaceae bacterium]